MEMSLNSVERVQEYFEIEQEVSTHHTDDASGSVVTEETLCPEVQGLSIFLKVYRFTMLIF